MEARPYTPPRVECIEAGTLWLCTSPDQYGANGYIYDFNEGSSF